MAPVATTGRVSGGSGVAIVSVKEIHDGRDGDDEVSKRKGIRRYTRVFRVTTDSNSDDANMVLAAAGLPGPGAVYPTDMGAWLRRRRARNESFSKRVWIVTLAYSSEYELSDNPLDDPARISWGTETYQAPAVKDRDGEALLNSAGDPFDPPAMQDKSRVVAHVRKNVSTIPAWFFGYKDTVNSSAFTLDGVAFGEGVAKIRSLELSEPQERNDIAYRTLSICIEFFNSNEYCESAEDAWALCVLDSGMRRRHPDSGELVDCINNGDGQSVSSPALLDGSGEQIEDPSPADAVYLPFHVYYKADFNALPLT